MKNEPLVSVQQLLSEVHRLEIATRGTVDTLLLGAYRSGFKGNGLEFHQVREYTPEDDYRSIDWNVTARLNSPYIKTFVEERELHLIFAVDFSASMNPKGIRSFKKETVLKFCATLALTAIQQQDQVGLLIFTDQVERFLPPNRGKAAAFRLLKELLTFQPKGLRTRYEPALNYLARGLKRRSVLFWLSDFTEPIPMNLASMLGKRHDVIAISIHDPLEEITTLPSRITVQDPETGRVGYISKSNLRLLREAIATRELQLKQLTQKGIDRMDLIAGENLDPIVRRFFQNRIEKRDRR
jgi:uncharacterized protein (DUF58 family)